MLAELISPQAVHHRSARRVVIVGGTSGIGLATAHRLAATGSQAIVLCGRSFERGEAARAALAAHYPALTTYYVPCDASDSRSTERAMGEAVKAMDGIDALVSCAAADVMPQLLADISTSDLMPALSAVAACVILPARAAYDVMRQQGAGSIVCVASDAAKIATPGESVIGAAMAAIAMFCRGMAIEAKRDGIRVNCVTPSIVKGTALYTRLQDNEFARRLFGKAEAMASLGVVTADEVAELIAFLASPAACKITGQTISVTGGISAA